MATSEEKNLLIRQTGTMKRIHKEGAQIKKHSNNLGKKLRAGEFLISKIGLGVDYKIGVAIVDLVVSINRSSKKVPTNLVKMKSTFYGKHATSEMSFALGMVASPINHNQKSKGKAIDMEQHVIVIKRMRIVPMLTSNALVQRKANLPLDVQISHKRKSEARNSSDGKRVENKATTFPYQTGTGTGEGTSPNFPLGIGFHIER
ncbi:LOW QUALITY PROTEIN: hypothetical protein Cgig2_022529 [Carnegiea gigantea]|uniref:Uncharacterized protein n=1 Tax=Carnegiea gigantea TaxID=171969 RepID=A0A9Q1JJ53_9CARY|nr:LOW QUALITY PROTEIN: hypothetical protein Cgig2_022529 [Carnegiea gigantea]